MWEWFPKIPLWDERELYKDNIIHRKAKLINSEYLMQPDFKKIL